MSYDSGASTGRADWPLNWARPLRPLIFKLLGRLRWPADRLVVLYCHDVGEVRHPMCIPAETFAHQMRVLAGEGWLVLPLSEALRRWEDGSALGDRVIALCFDDGFEGVYEYALPVLEDLGYRATVFVCTKFIGGAPCWPGVESYLSCARAHHRNVRLLDRTQIADLHRRGWEIGAHSVTHPALCDLAETEVETEIGDSRRALELLIDGPVESFCYPDGLANDLVRRLVLDSGIRTACGIRTGHVDRSTSRLSLPRLHLDGSVDRAALDAMLSPLFPWYLRLSDALKGTRARGD